MKITNVRVMNNYKIKLINAKLSGVNVTQEIVAEQGTRTPIPQTPSTQAETATEKFDRVMNYLIGRYEPGWSASDPAVGRAAVMASMGLSASINPLVAGGTLESMFNGLTASDVGYFNPLTHPKDFAAAVKNAYKVFERARKPIQAKHRFMDYSTAGIGNYSYLDDGGNAFFGSEKNMLWYPEPDNTNYNNYDYRYSYKGYAADYANGIERYMLHSPYGIFRSPMFQPAGYNVGKSSIPWMTDRYAPNAGWVFDAYLKLREETTLRDLLNDNSVERDPLLGVLVDGVTDTYLNSYYSGNCYPAGLYSRGIESNLPIINRDRGGYGPNEVRIGKPWIPYPNGITWRGNLGLLADGGATLNFNAITLVMTDGSPFPNTPPTITDLNVDYASGISYGNGQTRLDRLNALADAWGNSMEFTLYSGLLPYGAGYEQYMPFMLYKDPTIPENVRYMRWRMDASMSHWKEKFKSPIDGFAHVITDSLVGVERTYHQWTGPTFASWSNVLPGNTSWVENIPVAWARDQFNYTYGPSADTSFSPITGIVWGAELFGWYDWNARADQKKSSTDSNPNMWVLDEDIASPLYTSIYDLVVGQRFNGLAKASSIWGMGVCGTSTLGELYTICKLEDKRTPDGYPFFYNTFIGMDATNNNLLWKGVPGTSCDWSGSTVTPSGTVPWCNDRRFRLFYLYPLALALGGTVVDQMHNGYAYYGVNGWFDIRLPATNGVHIFHGDQEAYGIGTIVSDFPHPGRRTANTPPQNFWTGIARTSEFELLYACMKGGLTAGLDSLGFTKLYSELLAGNSDVTPHNGYYYYRAVLESRSLSGSLNGRSGNNQIVTPTNSDSLYRRYISPYRFWMSREVTPVKDSYSDVNISFQCLDPTDIKAERARDATGVQIYQLNSDNFVERHLLDNWYGQPFFPGYGWDDRLLRWISPTGSGGTDIEHIITNPTLREPPPSPSSPTPWWEDTDTFPANYEPEREFNPINEEGTPPYIDEDTIYSDVWLCGRFFIDDKTQEYWFRACDGKLFAWNPKGFWFQWGVGDDPNHDSGHMIENPDCRYAEDEAINREYLRERGLEEFYEYIRHLEYLRSLGWLPPNFPVPVVEDWHHSGEGILISVPQYESRIKPKVR